MEAVSSILNSVDKALLKQFDNLLNNVRSLYEQDGNGFPEPSFIAVDVDMDYFPSTLVLRWGYNLCWYCDTSDETVKLVEGFQRRSAVYSWNDTITIQRLVHSLKHVSCK